MAMTWIIVMIIGTIINVVCAIIHIKCFKMDSITTTKNKAAMMERNQLDRETTYKYNAMIVEYQRYTDKLNEFREYVEKKGKERDDSQA